MLLFSIMVRRSPKLDICFCGVYNSYLPSIKNIWSSLPKKKKKKRDNKILPCGPVVKNPSVNARDTGLIPGLGIKNPYVMGQLNPCATTIEPTHSRNQCSATREATLLWDTCALQLENGLHLLRLEKAHATVKTQCGQKITKWGQRQSWAFPINGVKMEEKGIWGREDDFFQETRRRSL